MVVKGGARRREECLRDDNKSERAAKIIKNIILVSRRVDTTACRALTRAVADEMCLVSRVCSHEQDSTTILTHCYLVVFYSRFYV